MELRKRYLTTQEVVLYLALEDTDVDPECPDMCKVKFLYINSGFPAPSILTFKHPRWDIEEIDEWMASGKYEPTPDVCVEFDYMAEEEAKVNAPTYPNMPWEQITT